MRSGISKLKFSFLFPIVLFATVLVSTPPAYAIPVEDIPASIWRAIKDVIAKSGSQIFNSVLTTAVNQLAYDYATYLGSGASGQKPFFEQKPLGRGTPHSDNLSRMLPRTDFGRLSAMRTAI